MSIFLTLFLFGIMVLTSLLLFHKALKEDKVTHLGGFLVLVLLMMVIAGTQR